MKLSKSNEKCVVCNAYLFEEDDVVYCPTCGAPHHRECYNFVGHCGMQEFHGTENEYKKPEKENESDINKDETEQNVQLVTCGMCGNKYSADKVYCPKCNAPNMAKIGAAKFVSYDFLGGVKPDTDLGKGVTADDAKKFVGSNTHRYIPKFLKFKQGKKISWNWLAFITPSGWFMSRKMYLLGALAATLEVAFKVLLIPFMNVIYQLDPELTLGWLDLSNKLLENISSTGSSAIILAEISFLLLAIFRVAVALFGDLIYKNRVITKTCEIKLNSDSAELDYRKKGGISLMAAVLGYYLPSLILNVLLGLL